jgi:hypothetical protein
VARTFVAGALFGAVVATVLGAAAGLHADGAAEDVAHAAELAGVDVQDLQGAVNSVGVDPYTYLRSTGELPPLPPQSYTSQSYTSQSSARAACIISHESQNNPRAVNPRSGASGLGQFLSSTWKTTPQGRAGLSVFDPAANRAAVEYMLAAGRAGEFQVVTSGLC